MDMKFFNEIEEPEPALLKSFDKNYENKEIYEFCLRTITPRSILLERYFPSNPNVPIFEWFNEKHKTSLLNGKKTTTYQALVWEYYAHAAAYKSTSCKMRKKSINITVDTFRSVYKLPEISDCLYQAYKSKKKTELDMDFDEVLNLLTDNQQAEWTMKNGIPISLKREFLTNNARFVLYFLSANVWPVTHVSDVSRDKACLIYFLLSGQPVDLAIIMYGQLQKSLTAHNMCLLFGHFITQICQSKGIKPSSKDGKMRPRDAFNYTLLTGDHENKGSSEEPSHSIQPQPVSNPTIKDLFGLMQQMQQMQQHNKETLEKQGNKIEKMMRKVNLITQHLGIRGSLDSDEATNPEAIPSTSMNGDQPMEEDLCAP